MVPSLAFFEVALFARARSASEWIPGNFNTLEAASGWKPKLTRLCFLWLCDFGNREAMVCTSPGLQSGGNACVHGYCLSCLRHSECTTARQAFRVGEFPRWRFGLGFCEVKWSPCWRFCGCACLGITKRCYAQAQDFSPRGTAKSERQVPEGRQADLDKLPVVPPGFWDVCCSEPWICVHGYCLSYLRHSMVHLRNGHIGVHLAHRTHADSENALPRLNHRCGLRAHYGDFAGR